MGVISSSGYMSELTPSRWRSYNMILLSGTCFLLGEIYADLLLLKYMPTLKETIAVFKKIRRLNLRVPPGSVFNFRHLSLPPLYGREGQVKFLRWKALGESFPTSIYLQNLASIQTRTSLLKFEGGGFSAPVIFPLRVFTRNLRVCKIGESPEGTAQGDPRLEHTGERVRS